jgi:CAI-1 autoinducer synthase
LQHEVAGLAATLKVIQGEDWRRQRLWRNTRYLRQGLTKIGYAVDQTTSQIVALHSGNDEQTRALRNALEEQSIFGAVFCSPATPKNHGIIRLSVNARLSEADLDRVIHACDAIAKARCVNPWPKNLLKQDVTRAAATTADVKTWIDPVAPDAGAQHA